MQVFLPYRSFRQSALCLDTRRLNKQIIELKQIIKASVKGFGAWSNHLIVRAWRDHESALIIYGLQCCIEYTKRTGKTHATEAWFKALISDNCVFKNDKRYLPDWCYCLEITNQYKANLLAKDPDHYSQFNWQVQPSTTRLYYVDEQFVERN